MQDYHKTATNLALIATSQQKTVENSEDCPLREKDMYSLRSLLLWEAMHGSSIVQQCQKAIF